MADDDVIRGADAFHDLSKRLKGMGGGLRAQFLKDVRQAAKPLLPAVRRQAAARFPHAGGLDRHMARGARYRIVAKTGASTAGISIRANRTDPRADTRGRIAHPVPGPGGRPLLNAKGQRIMVTQFVPDAVGFFRDTIEERADAVRDDLVQRMERWALEQLTGGGPRG